MAKVSINKIDKLIKAFATDNVYKLSVRAGDEEISVSIKKYLQPAEEFSCSSSIADAVFINGEYVPEVYNSAVMMNFVAYYTDLKIEAGVERIYRLFYESDIMDQMMRHINYDQFEFICDSAKERINHRLRMEENVQRMKVDELIHNLDVATESLNTITSSFSHIDADVMSDAINKLATIDEKKVIEIISAK